MGHSKYTLVCIYKVLTYTAVLAVNHILQVHAEYVNLMMSTTCYDVTIPVE